jgi:pilus assembly protein CpaB
MRSIRSRKVLGAICVAMAILLILALILLPGVFDDAGSAVRAYIAKENILKGEKITEEMVEIRQIEKGVFPLTGLPSDVVGKYAVVGIPQGDIVLSGKIMDGRPPGEYASVLDGTKVAISLSIKSFAYGLSGLLRAGDIASVYASASYNNVSIAPAITTTEPAVYSDGGDIIAPPELKYMYVLAVTDEDGTDKDEHELATKEDDGVGDGDEWNAATVTLLATPLQAERLAFLEVNGLIQFALVYRGDEVTTQEFLSKQDEYLQELAAKTENAGDVQSSQEGAEDAAETEDTQSAENTEEQTDVDVDG